MTATIHVDKPGVYAFRLTCDDGGRLYVDDHTIVNHDGKHGATAKESNTELTAGDQKFAVAYFQAAAAMRLTIEWRRPDDLKFALMRGPDVLVDPGVTPVVSAGPKKLRVQG